MRIDVPAFPVPNKKSSDEGASSDTELGSEEEEESDYDNDEDVEEEETDEDEESEDEMDSATEIETDSEFDHDIDVRMQGIPTIIVNESEAEQMKRSLDHLANGLDEKAPGQSSDPKPEYVEQYVPLEPARPLQRTISNEDRKPLSINPTPAPYSGVGLLAYLRRSELLEKSPSTVDVMGSDLKKRYDYGGSLAQKSASTTNLDSKLRSFVDTISEAQKKLNPAPQPSVPMQVSCFFS